jgi:hypothetical protein
MTFKIYHKFLIDLEKKGTGITKILLSKERQKLNRDRMKSKRFRLKLKNFRNWLRSKKTLLKKKKKLFLKNKKKSKIKTKSQKTVPQILFRLSKLTKIITTTL